MKINPEWTGTQTAREARKQGYGGDDGEVYELPLVKAAFENDARQGLDAEIAKIHADEKLRKDLEIAKKAGERTVSAVLINHVVVPVVEKDNVLADR